MAMWHRPLFVWNEKNLSSHSDHGDESPAPALPARADQNEWGRWVRARLERLMTAFVSREQPFSVIPGLPAGRPDTTVRKSA